MAENKRRKVENGSKQDSWKDNKFMDSNMNCVEEFYEAVRTGSVDMLEQFLANDGLDLTSKLAQSCNEDGETPLLLAIKSKHFQVVKFLIEDLDVNFGEIGRFFWKSVDYGEVLPLFASIISDQRSIMKYLITKEMKYKPSISLDSEMSLRRNNVPRPQKIDQLELIGAAFILLRGSSTYYVEENHRDNDGLRARMYWLQAMILRHRPDEGEPEIPKIPFQLSSRGLEAFNLDNISETMTLEQVQQETTSFTASEAFSVAIRILSRAGLFPSLFIIENFYWLFMFELASTQFHDEYANSIYVFRQANYLMELLESYKWEDDIQDLTRFSILDYDSCFNDNCDESNLALSIVRQVIDDMVAHLPSENWESWHNMNTFPVEFANFDNCMLVFNFCCNHISRVFAKFRHVDQPSSIKLIKDETEQVTILLAGIAGFIDVILMPHLTAGEIQQFKETISKYIHICDELGTSRANFFNRFCCLNHRYYAPYYRKHASHVIQFFINSGMLDPNAVDEEGNTILHKLIDRKCCWIANMHAGNLDVGEIKPRFLFLLQILDNDGQIDKANNLGKTVRGILGKYKMELDGKECFIHPSIDKVINRLNVLPLSSCCAQLVWKQQISFEHLELPSILKEFLRRGSQKVVNQE